MERPTRKQAFKRAINLEDVGLIAIGVATIWFPPLGAALACYGVKSVHDKYRKARDLVEEELELDKKLLQVKFFNGTKEEYEKTAGYEVDVIDTQKRDRDVVFRDNPDSWRGTLHKDIPVRCVGDVHFKDYLVSKGVEALVGCTLMPGRCTTRHGVPVASKYVDSRE